MEVLRLPFGLTTRERFARAETALARWQPDWVSLQMVAYGFNNRGLLFKEVQWMPRLLAPYWRHVMLHELWIGEHDWSSWKDVAVGTLQRWAMLRLLDRLAPAVIQTSTPAFQEILRHRGVDAGLLPLFGNIPVSDRSAEPWLLEALRREGAAGSAAERETCWIFGIFGGIAGIWAADAILTRIADIAARARRHVIVASVGRTAPYTVSMVENWRRRFPQISFAMLGPRPADEVSEFLNSVDFCLTSYPLQLLGKSGAAAAALEHGVPVITSWGYGVGDGAAPAAPESLVWKNDAALEARLLNPPPRKKIYDAPEQRALQLVRDLSRFRGPHERTPVSLHAAATLAKG